MICVTCRWRAKLCVCTKRSRESSFVINFVIIFFYFCNFFVISFCNLSPVIPLWRATARNHESCASMLPSWILWRLVRQLLYRYQLRVDKWLCVSLVRCRSPTVFWETNKIVHSLTCLSNDVYYFNGVTPTSREHVKNHKKCIYNRLKKCTMSWSGEIIRKSLVSLQRIEGSSHLN